MMTGSSTIGSCESGSILWTPAPGMSNAMVSVPPDAFAQSIA